ncbi:hypothetical protein PR048_024489 [Dryococelus australis]|uniref:Uncharacterized protein n=1 Tax=Dryococelus australis TaxID=614101 RepID=A0ABQ9GNP5_9NEOP|nr:hypothetical protein PR048_024489 [Dryococelus australis]
MVKLLASHQGEPVSIPCGVTPGYSHVGIIPDDAVGRRVFSGISRFSRPFIPELLHIRFNHPHRLPRPRWLKRSWSPGFLGDLPFFPPAPSFRRCSILASLHPSSALKISMLRAAQISSLTEQVRRHDADAPTNKENEQRGNNELSKEPG